VDRDELKAADLAITIDYNDDGSIDYRGSLSPLGGGTKNYEIDVGSNGNMVWSFDLIGQGGKVQNPFKQQNYVELRIEYDISVNIYFSGSSMMNFTRPSSIYSELDFGQPVSASDNHIINKTVHFYDLSKVQYTPPSKKPKTTTEELPGYLYCLAALLIAVPIAWYIIKRLKDRKIEKDI
jgi:hypothetical protein